CADRRAVRGQRRCHSFYPVRGTPAVPRGTLCKACLQYPLGPVYRPYGTDRSSASTWLLSMLIRISHTCLANPWAAVPPLHSPDFRHPEQSRDKAYVRRSPQWWNTLHGTSLVEDF